MKFPRLAFAVSFLFVIVIAGWSVAASASALTNRPALANVTYCTANGIDLKMDLYFSDHVDAMPKPAAVYVHGGGWISGDKAGGAGVADIQELVGRGYVVAAINYRLAPKFKFPAQIEDVKCAVRSLRANASKYGIDPTRIGAWGGSAGGHLVALLGVADEKAGFDVGQYLDQSSRVQAVVDYFGPTDLMSLRNIEVGRERLTEVFGSSENVKRASPLAYISKDDPPFLIVHGESDAVVSLHHSEILYEQLVAGDVPANLLVVENAGHGFRRTNGPINPTRAAITKTMANFFDEHLNGTWNLDTGTSSPIREQPGEPYLGYLAAAAVIGGIILTGMVILGKKRKTSNKQ